MVKYPEKAYIKNMLELIKNSFKNNNYSQELIDYRENFLELFDLCDKIFFTQELTKFINLDIVLTQELYTQASCTSLTIQSLNSHDSALKNGKIYSLEAVFSYYPEIKTQVQALFSCLEKTKSSWGYFVASVYTQAFVVYICQDNIQDEPVILDQLFTNTQGYLLLVIIIEEQTCVTLQRKILTQAQFYGQQVIILVRPYAQVTYIADGDYAHNFIDAELWYIQAHAHVKIVQTVTSQAQAVLVRDYNLVGEHAQVYWQGATNLSNYDTCAFVTYQKHVAAHTISSLELRGILQAASSLFYTGTVEIAQQAEYAQAQQQELALLLSTKARHCAVPALEIKNAQVTCKHGSATGVINQEQLWYLLSRGLETAQAQRLILDGFFEHINTNYILQVEQALERIKAKSGELLL